MAILALLTFTLVILNSTVRINADFQLITVLSKLIESVEQLNSSISKINGRLDKLEDTIPTRPEYIKPDPEPMHGRVDEKVKKALESEKVFIRKSLSVCEKKFHVFEAQVNRHLSSMYIAIESNKDKVDEQIRQINESLDWKSDALHVQQEIQQINDTFDRTKDKLDEQIRLINESLDRKSDALHVQQEIRQINATFDRTKDNFDKQIRLMNVSLDRKSDALHVQQEIQRINATFDRTKDKLDEQIRLMNETLDRKSDALHVQQDIRRINATFDRTKDKFDKQIRLMNETLDRKSDALHVQQEIQRINATFEQLYSTLRCSYSPGTFQLYSGNTELNIVEHNSMVEVKCKNGDNYELKNTDTDQYIDSFNTKCLFGHLDKDLSVLKCLPKRCSYSHGSLQLYSGNTQLNIAEHDSTVNVKCKNGENYELKNTDQFIDSFNTKCLFGHLENIGVLKCLPKRCFNDNSKIALYTGDRNTHVVTHTSKVDVKCIDDGYELKNTKTVKYESNLTTTCRFGKFDYQISQLTCLPRRPNIMYSVRLKVSEARGQYVKVNVRIVGNGQTAELQLNGVYYDWRLNELDDLYFTETDVRPIQSAVVSISKDRGIRRDDYLSMEYVSIYIEESDEYYAFTGTSLHTNLTDSQPLTLTLSDHPEKCSSHTYGKALERGPYHTSWLYVGLITLHECKIRCITTQSIKCKSVFYIPVNSRYGQCYLKEHSPDDDRYFRDNNSGETNRGDVSYKRICKTT